MKDVNVNGQVFTRAEGATDDAVIAAARELRVTGRALAWLERARLCVMAGGADYERGYANVRALVEASLEAREQYDRAMGSALGLVQSAPGNLTREDFAVLLPEVLGGFLRPEPLKPVAAPPENRTDVDAEPPYDPPENPLG